MPDDTTRGAATEAALDAWHSTSHATGSVPGFRAGFEAGASWQREALAQAEADNDRLMRRAIAAEAALETCRKAREAGQ